MAKQLTFEPITLHKPGVIERLLVESFAGMASDGAEQEKCRRKWHRTDRETFENPETIGRCTFITTLNGKPIGVPACRFYAACGCHLGSIDRYGYANDPRFAHESMLIWYLDL